MTWSALRLCSESALWLALLAIFVSAQCAYPQTAPQITVQLSNGIAHLNIIGDVGSDCTIQSVTNLSQNWQFVTNLTLLSSPFLLVDAAGPGTDQRFYRLYAQQVPTNVLVTNMVWISPGTFTMGSTNTEAERGSDETQHKVTLTKGFFMGKYPVTQSEYQAVTGSNPSYFTGNSNLPVEQVSWIDATNYCAKLNQRELAAGRLPAGWIYRLPTESEWEYSCRAGTTTAFHYGSALHGGMANFYSYSEYEAALGTILVTNPIGYVGQTTVVGSYQPNEWGLYDMHGNVWEHCQDWYGSYPDGSVSDPQGPSTGTNRVMRGGSWLGSGVQARSGRRDYRVPSNLGYRIGFRVVLSPGQP